MSSRRFQMCRAGAIREVASVIMLIRQIEIFLRRTGMPATTFGRLAARDPRFVSDLRNGREPRSETTKRMEHFMNEYRKDNHAF